MKLILLLYYRIEHELIVGSIFLLLEYSRKKLFETLVIHAIDQIMNG